MMPKQWKKESWRKTDGVPTASDGVIDKRRCSAVAANSDDFSVLGYLYTISIYERGCAAGQSRFFMPLPEHI